MLVFVIAVAWFAFGAIAVLVMRRRGHDAFGWAIVFLFLGPLALPAALNADRHRPPEVARPVHAGELDVLVADDGSAAAAAALDAALALLGRQMTSLTLVSVVDIEASTTVRGRDTENEAQQRLEALAGQVAGLTSAPVDAVVLHGDPAAVLAQFAGDHGYELIVTGGSGPGGSHVLRGSVARRLVACATVPVLVGPNES